MQDTVLTEERLCARIRALRERDGNIRETVLGRSLLGRGIPRLTVGFGRPVSLFVAVHHAMEWLTGEMLLLFLERGDYRFGKGTIHIVPLLNPDGVALVAGEYDGGSILAARQKKANGGETDFSRWQANGRGVDLNHNYDARFYAYAAVRKRAGVSDFAPSLYEGPSPLSEPETQALFGFLLYTRPDCVLSLHTQGRELFAGITPSARTENAARILARRTGYTYHAPEGTAAFGGLTDALSLSGIPALTVECGRGRNPLPRGDLDKVYREVLPILLHAPRLLAQM